MKLYQLLLLFFFILTSFVAHATHNRAGEITYRQISQYTYEATIVVYTKTSSPPDRPDLPISWGDGTVDTIPRISEVILPNDIKKNVYQGVHTYPAPAVYIISFEDPNRNAGVVNIPNSVSIPFYVQSQLVINPFLGFNSSPVLLQPPIDRGCVNRVFIHNPNAYDPDGDSLSYSLVVSRGSGGQPIPGFTIPTASNSISIDNFTGELIWDSPILQGEYNIAILIEEWRDGIRIGYVTRDMQIDIGFCTNNPPVISPIADYCVEAGSSINFSVSATDQDNDQITLTATGGPFMVSNPANFPQPIFGVGQVIAPFSWLTNCSNVRKQPYQVVFKAEDSNNQITLVDLEQVNITVVGPSPKNPTATPFGNTINLSWNKSACSNAVGYKIYKRTGYFGFFPSNCELGVPAYTGYSLILSRQGLNDTTYVDNNNGAGLVPGAEYCYMIVAYYPDGAESYASLEVCTELIKDVPVITNVSVVKTDQANGEIYVAWSKPTEFDSTAYPGPYQYVVYRSIGFAASDLIPVATVNDINDTTFVDTSINTLDNAWSYKIEFFGLPNASLGFSQAASSAFLTLTPTDNTIILNWEEHVPWTNNFDANSQYVIYRKDPVATQFDSIGVSNTNSYIDTGLNNGDSFCYYIKTVGKYFAPDYIDPIENLSQQACAIPIDNIPPCSPVFTVSPGCVSNSNFITWTIPVRECENDVLEFNLYHTSHPDQPFQLIYSTTSLLDSVFNHNNLYSIAGCYMVTSIDSGGNESLNNLVICVENCPVYNIPNIFSPDGDGVNDILHPCDLTTTDDMQVLCPPYQYIQDIHIQIFNRWGNLVYETTDLQINWDGTHQDTGKPCSPGVYYYVCTVNEIYLMGVKPRVINGFVTLARNFDK